MRKRPDGRQFRETAISVPLAVEEVARLIGEKSPDLALIAGLERQPRVAERVAAERNDDAVVDLEVLVELLLFCFVLQRELVADAILERDELILDGLRLQLAVHELDALGLDAAQDRAKQPVARPVPVLRGDL